MSDGTEVPLLDDAILNALAGGSGDDVVAMLVEGFLEEAAERAEAIQAAQQAGDAEAVGFQAHALKSTSATYGAARLRDVAASLETAAKTDDQATINEGVSAIGGLWNATEKAFRARFLS